MFPVTVMEGSFGTQLTKYVGEIIDGDPLWSARFLSTHKKECIKAHRDLVRAGTQILTTGSYQATVDGLMKYLGVNRDSAIAIIKDSVYLAKEAIKQEEEATATKLNVQVAGSVGPYGAYLHDGSDYTGSYKDKVTVEELIAWHRPRFEALIDAGADLLGFETIPAMIEARALIQLLKEYPKMKAWVSFSCQDEVRISSGENFCNVAVQCWELGKGQLIAVGINCLNPILVTPLVKSVRENDPSIPLMVYPNSGEIYDKTKGRWLDKETSLSLSDYTGEWLDLGVAFIGGCCRTNDVDVKQFCLEVEKWKNK